MVGQAQQIEGGTLPLGDDGQGPGPALLVQPYPQQGRELPFRVAAQPERPRVGGEPADPGVAVGDVQLEGGAARSRVEHEGLPTPSRAAADERETTVRTHVADPEGGGALLAEQQNRCGCCIRIDQIGRQAARAGRAEGGAVAFGRRRSPRPAAGGRRRTVRFRRQVSRSGVLRAHRGRMRHGDGEGGAVARPASEVSRTPVLRAREDLTSGAVGAHHENAGVLPAARRRGVGDPASVRRPGHLGDRVGVAVQHVHLRPPGGAAPQLGDPGPVADERHVRARRVGRRVPASVGGQEGRRVGAAMGGQRDRRRGCSRPRRGRSGTGGTGGTGGRAGRSVRVAQRFRVLQGHGPPLPGFRFRRRPFTRFRASAARSPTTPPARGCWPRVWCDGGWAPRAARAPVAGRRCRVGVLPGP